METTRRARGGSGISTALAVALISVLIIITGSGSPAHADAMPATSPAPTGLSAAVEPTLPAAGRIGGNDRYARAILASQASYPAGAETVLVANGAASVGPVIAATMAAARNAPLLYAGTNSFSAAVADEIRRLSPATIVLVGSDDDVSRALLNSLSAIAPVERILLTSRQQGSLIALQGAGEVDTVYVTGTGLNDLAAASATAVATGGAALMVDGRLAAVSAETLAALRAASATQIVVVGGTAAVSSAMETSLAGAGFAVSRIQAADVYATSLALAKRVDGPVTRVFAANPSVVWDVATATALAGVTRQPLVYTPYQCMFSTIATHIDAIGAGVVGVGKTNWLRDAAVENVKCSEEKPRLDAALSAAIQSAAARYSGSYAVTVRELGRVGQSAHINGSARLEPASMMKLYAAWEALLKIQNGSASLSTKPVSTTLGTCLRVMIHASDNSCHTDIVHWLNIGHLNWRLSTSGFSNSSYGSVPWGTSVLYAGNRSTTDDLTRFVMMLERGQLLNKANTDYLLGLMETQIWTSRIASGVPPVAEQASKPGALWLPDGLLQADTGIIRGPQTSFVISIIGTNGADKAALPAITRAVYSHFLGSFGAATTYPVQQMETTTTTTKRSSPGGQSVGVIPAGTPLEVTDADRVWYKVWHLGALVWVDSRQLRNRW